MTPNYIILKDTSYSVMEDKVNKMIEEGYLPIGGLIEGVPEYIIQKSTRMVCKTFMQAMLRVGPMGHKHEA